MGVGYMDPHRTAGPCWWCHYFDGFEPGGVHALCSRPAACRVVAQPANGCAFYLREVGADDEAGPPSGPSRPALAGGMRPGATPSAGSVPTAWAP